MIIKDKLIENILYIILYMLDINKKFTSCIYCKRFYFELSKGHIQIIQAYNSGYQNILYNIYLSYGSNRFKFLNIIRYELYEKFSKLENKGNLINLKIYHELYESSVNAMKKIKETK